MTMEFKRKNNAITHELTSGFLKLSKDNLNVPREFCMVQKLIKGSLEEKVYADPGSIVLFANRNHLNQLQE
jgi:hypothetical protein